MRFRLSTMLLSLALACVIAGWAFHNWRERQSHQNEYVVASEFARFNAYNDVYGMMGDAKGDADFERVKKALLLNTVKSTQYLLTLSIPAKKQILREDYKTSLYFVSKEALEILEISSVAEFQQAVVANGGLELVKWEQQNPERKLNVQVLDHDTKQLKNEFVGYLEAVLRYKK